jgi:hypothetical protein
MIALGKIIVKSNLIKMHSSTLLNMLEYIADLEFVCLFWGRGLLFFNILIPGVPETQNISKYIMYQQQNLVTVNRTFFSLKEI